MSEEFYIKTLENIKEYMQNSIDKGYHKFIYNDLGWDVKCVDVISAIDMLIEKNKELEYSLKNNVVTKYCIRHKADDYESKGYIEIAGAMRELLEERN